MKQKNNINLNKSRDEEIISQWSCFLRAIGNAIPKGCMYIVRSCYFRVRGVREEGISGTYTASCNPFYKNYEEHEVTFYKFCVISTCLILS